MIEVAKGPEHLNYDTNLLKNLVIQLEILCADCMSQHSLQAEKIDSYKRILSLSENFEANATAVTVNNGFPRSCMQISDSQIVQ